VRAEVLCVRVVVQMLVPAQYLALLAVVYHSPQAARRAETRGADTATHARTRAR